MDINLYSQDSIDKKIILDFGQYVFDESDITENAEYTRSVNPNGDFIIGTSSCVQFKFELNNLYQTIPDIAGLEFTLKRGIQTETKSILNTYQNIKSNLIVLNGDYIFVGNSKPPYLSVYNSSFQMQTPPEQPTEQIQSLFIVNDILYCGHNNEPYLTAYTIINANLTKKSTAKLDTFQLSKIQRFNAMGKAFVMDNNILKEYKIIKYDLKIIDYIETTFEFSQHGIFIAEKPEKLNDNKIVVVSYDRMVKFESFVDDVINNLYYPISMLNYLKAICGRCGIILATTSFTNSEFMIPENYKTQNTTGRKALEWVAQVAASFVWIDEKGQLCIGWYTSKNYAIDDKQLTSISVAEYKTDVIDKVQVRYSEPDIGVIVPINESKTNAYIIENNPLLYTKTDSLIRPCVENIYNKLKFFNYTPFTANVIQGNPFITAGHIIEVKTRNGKLFGGLIMESTIKGVKALSATYKSTGNKTRAVQSDSVNQQIQRLGGRTNEIIATVDKLEVTLTEVNSATEKNTAQLLIQANQISLKVSQTDYNGNKISSLINQTATQILIQASKINLVGYVTVTDLITDKLTVNGTFKSSMGSEEIIIEDGRVEFYYGNTEMGTIYTNSNIGQKLTIGGQKGIRFAAGGYLRGEILPDGTFYNNRYNISTDAKFQLMGAYSSEQGSLSLDSYNNVVLKSQKDICLSPWSSSNAVYIGSSTSSLSDIHARDYYQGSYKGYTGSISYMKTATSSGTITIKGGIITGVN